MKRLRPLGGFMPRPLLRGMVCNRKPTNFSRQPNLATQRKRILTAKWKRFEACEGGLLDGHKLYLSCKGTLPFSIGGVKGYYDNEMKWVEL